MVWYGYFLESPNMLWPGAWLACFNTMVTISHNPTRKYHEYHACSYFTTILSCILQKSQKIKLKFKVLQMTDEDKLKSPTRKLKKNKGISSKYLTKLITGNYWMRPIMIWRFKSRSWKGVIYRQIFTQLDQGPVVRRPIST